jgi:DNA repair protein RadC
MSNSGDKRREKLESRILSSSRSLVDREVLELILYSGCCKEESREVSQRLIGFFNSMGKVISADFYDLKNVTGMNNSAIATILCIKEALERTLKGELDERPIIDNWKKLIEYLKVTIGQGGRENFRVIYLNKQYNLIDEYIQDTGTVDQTPIYIREVIKRALLIEATSMVVSHNHPGGKEPKPSKADIEITKQLSQACFFMGMELVDHIIITATNHFSFHNNGLL